MLKEPKRRMSDKFEGNSDHDLLIAHSVKIDSMCKLVTALGKKFDLFTDRVDKRCERRQTEFMDMDTFKWLMGFMILTIMLMVSAIGYNQVKIRAQESSYQFSIEQIKKNQKYIGKLQQIISLKLGIYDAHLMGKHELVKPNNNGEIINDYNE